VAHKVDIGKHVITASGADYYAVNPKGNVPCLTLEDGTLLNEGAATLQWIADHAAAGSNLAPANGTSGRYLLINTMNYLASEVHASYGPLFGPGSDEFKTAQKAKLATKFKYVAENILKGDFLGGENFAITDSYLYVMLGWAGYVGVDLAPFPTLQAFQARVAALDFVKEAHAAMNAAP
jgi:glutathione S-transferase